MESGTYSFSCDFIQTGTQISTISASVRKYGVVNEYYAGKTSSEERGRLTFNFTIPDGDNGFRLYFYSNETGTSKTTSCTFSNIQLEEGSTATEYEPYGYKIPVTVETKNLFNVNNLITKNTVVNNGNETLSVTPTSGSTGVTTEQTLSTLVPALQVGQTYTLSFNTTANTKYIYLGTSKSTWISGASRTITQDDLDSKVYWYANGLDTTFTAIISNIQIEEGSTATNYVPYIGTYNVYLDAPLRSVGDVADYIDLETGTVVRNVGEKLFTGEETFYSYTNSSGGISFWVKVEDKQIGLNTSICSHFDYVEYSFSGIHDAQFGIYTDHDTLDRIYFKAPNSTITTIEEFKNWLQEQYNNGTPVNCVYLLVTPDTSETIAEVVNIPNGATITVGTTIQPSE